MSRRYRGNHWLIRDQMGPPAPVFRPRPTDASFLATGDMVVTRDGAMGVLIEHQAIGACTVTFGAAGPQRLYVWRHLRQATPDEIMDERLEGVGCNPYRPGLAALKQRLPS